MKKIILVIGALLALSSCSSKPDNIVSTQEPLEEIFPEEVIEREAGSLWERNNNSLFSDQKARAVGDIVTVIISESASASKEANTSTDRTTNMSAGIPNFFGLENSKFWSEAHNPIDVSNLVSADFSNSFTGNGSTTRKEDLTASLTTQVIGKYPNGQLKIRPGLSGLWTSPPPTR
jgi:flagellar L-ring protein precursor FlgH